MAEAPQQDVSKMSCEDALAELEQIVRGLESGQQKLEDAITAYERGAALKKHCEAKLAEAEARVQAIVAQADGSLALKDVGPKDPGLQAGGEGRHDRRDAPRRAGRARRNHRGVAGSVAAHVRRAGRP